VRLADVIELLPFFAVSVGLGGFTAHTEVNYVGATGPDWNLSHIQRCLIASRAVWFYLAKMFCPANLTFSYPRWAIHAHDIRLFLFPASVMLLVTSAWLLRNRIGRGPLAALLIFIGVLTPALGFFNTYPMRYSFVADHFQYTAGIAIIVLFSGTVVRILPQRLLVPIVGVVLAFLTWRQSQVYAGPQTLWRDVLAKNSSSWLADENLAVIFTYKPNPTRPELEEALQLYQRVQQLRPTHEKLQINWAEAFFKLGRWDEALSHYRLVTNSPGVNMNIVDDRMGIALLHLNRLDEADLIFQDALKKNGSDNDAECGLADVLAAQGHAADALAGYAGVLRHDADMAAAYRGSALALIELNRPTDAAARLERYLALVPNDAAAHEILARLDLELAKPSDAIKQFAVALALNPQSEAAKNGLADAINAQAKLAK
jgi:Tfp pilus assembly protein PilF